MEKDEKYKKINAHIEKKLEQHKNTLCLSTEKTNFHPDDLEKMTKNELIQMILKSQ